jgi:oxalate decarboxylase
MAAAAGKPPHPFVFRLADLPLSREAKSGKARIADSRNFIVSKTIVATRVEVKPGGLARCTGIRMPMNGPIFSRVARA